MRCLKADTGKWTGWLSAPYSSQKPARKGNCRSSRGRFVLAIAIAFAEVATPAVAGGQPVSVPPPSSPPEAASKSGCLPAPLLPIPLPFPLFFSLCACALTRADKCPPVESRGSAQSETRTQPSVEEVSATPSSGRTDAAFRVSSDADEEALAHSRVHERWDGWQTVTVDAAAVGVLLLGAAIATSGPPRLNGPPNPRPYAFGAVALGVYALGPPIVHLAHADVWRSLESVGLRVAMPLVGLVFGYLAAGGLQSHGTGALEAGEVGGLLGGVAAMATDATVLGWQRWYSPNLQHGSTLGVALSF